MAISQFGFESEPEYSSGIGALAPAPAPQIAYFQQNPDVAAAYQQNTYGLSPEDFAKAHWERFGQFEQRVSPFGVPAPAPAPTPAPAPAAPDYSGILTGYYQDILGRTPDQGGFDYWLNALQSGVTPEFVQQQFLSSPEYLAKQVPSPAPEPDSPDSMGCGCGASCLASGPGS